MNENSVARVAQVSNLLYRRLPVGNAPQALARPEIRSACGLEIRDTADSKSALRRICRFVAPVSNLLYRRLPAGRLSNGRRRLEFQSVSPGRRVCGLEIRDTADWKSALRDWGRPLWSGVVLLVVLTSASAAGGACGGLVLLKLNFLATLTRWAYTGFDLGLTLLALVSGLTLLVRLSAPATTTSASVQGAAKVNE
jgi:hypothetical protein